MCGLDRKSGHGVHVQHDVQHRVPLADAPLDVGGGLAAADGVAHVVSGGGHMHGGGLVDSALHHDSGWNFVVGDSISVPVGN